MELVIDNELLTWPQVMKAQRKVRSLKDPTISLVVNEIGPAGKIKSELRIYSDKRNAKPTRIGWYDHIKWKDETIIYEVSLIKTAVDCPVKTAAVDPRHKDMTVDDMMLLLASYGYNYGEDAAAAALVGYEVCLSNLMHLINQQHSELLDKVRSLSIASQ